MCTASVPTVNMIPTLVVVEVRKVVEEDVVRARERRLEAEPTGPQDLAGGQVGELKPRGEGNQTGTVTEDSQQEVEALVGTRRTASTRLRSKMEIFLELQGKIIQPSLLNNWRRRDSKGSSPPPRISFRRIIPNKAEPAELVRRLASGQDRGLALSQVRDLAELELVVETVPGLWMSVWEPVPQI